METIKGADRFIRQSQSILSNFFGTSELLRRFFPIPLTALDVLMDLLVEAAAVKSARADHIKQ